MSNDLLNALEQNRRNIKRLLDAVDAEYDLPNDPERDAKAAAIFDPDVKAVDKSDIELSEDERTMWLFRTNAEAIEAAAEAASGDAERSVVSQSKNMKAVESALGDGGSTERDTGDGAERATELSDVATALGGRE